tara:strand:+ start:1478 stop:2110 length:633 start_codon:yes stop_codon:yes gene_type:complete
MEKTVFNLSKLMNDKISYRRMSKYVKIRYNDSRLMLRTPLLRISSIELGESINIIKLKINNNNSKEYNFGEDLVNLDKYIFNKAKENRSWFDKDNYNYIGLIENNELTFKFKNSDDIKVKCNGESLNIRELKKNYLVKVIFDVSGIYINSNKFGIYLKPYLFDINVEYILDESDDDIDNNLIEREYLLSSSESENKNNEENNIELNNLTI